MCCFSREVDRVADTNIFARADKDGRQFVVYSMSYSAKAELSMILPVPVAKGSDEQAMKFVNLADYDKLFDDLKSGFPVPVGRGPLLGSKSDEKKAAPKTLEVVEVGSFVASFVPTVADFARLDEQFRLPAQTWDALPAYKDYGFAVFKLKSGERTVHPMAFSFPRADGEKLFFPTVHIHDGKVHATANFDHALFCQTAAGKVARWEESPLPAERFVKIDKTQGIVAGDRHVHRLRLSGRLKNTDVIV